MNYTFVSNIKGIVLNTRGGFANQLYEYAYAFCISMKYKRGITQIVRTQECGVDTYALDSFNLPFSSKIVISDIVYSRIIIDELIRRKKCYYITDNNAEDAIENYNSQIDDSEVIIINGTFQRYKYLKPYIKEIRNVFSLDNECISSFRNYIQGKISVGVHIRRQDFVYYGATSSDNYYKAAMVVLQKMIREKELIFFIFSDDIEYAKLLLGNSDSIRYMSKRTGRDAQFNDFFSLSLCNHRILTRGSSYGRMADILSNNDNKITIYRGNEDNKDGIIYLSEDMIKKGAAEYESIFYDGNVTNSDDNSLLYESSSLNEFLLRDRIEKGDYQYFEEYIDELFKRRAEADIIAAYIKCLFDGYAFSENKHRELFFRASVLYDFLKDNCFIIVPRRPFSSTLFEELYSFGFYISRCGGRCLFLFHFNTHEMEYAEKDNKILQNASSFVDAYGNSQGGRVLSISSNMEIKSIVNHIRNTNGIDENHRIIIITKDLAVLKSLQNDVCGVSRYFWDYSNRGDAGNYEKYDDNIEVDMCPYEIDDSKDCQDFKRITVNRNKIDGQGVLLDDIIELTNENRDFFSYCLTRKKNLVLLEKLMENER